MDFLEFVGCVVRIDLVSTNKYFYHGKVLEVDDKFLRMIDEKGRNIYIRFEEIRNISEDAHE